MSHNLSRLVWIFAFALIVTVSSSDAQPLPPLNNKKRARSVLKKAILRIRKNIRGVWDHGFLEKLCITMSSVSVLVGVGRSTVLGFTVIKDKDQTTLILSNWETVYKTDRGGS